MSDGNLKLKYIAYCMSQLPPESVKTTFEDVVQFAKFQLCIKNNRLMKDPIWDQYTDEEILVEHYAHNFSKSAEAKIEFEKEYMQGDAKIDDWMVEESQNLDSKVLEDRVSFKPENVGE